MSGVDLLTALAILLLGAIIMAAIAAWNKWGNS